MQYAFINIKYTFVKLNILLFLTNLKNPKKENLFIVYIFYLGGTITSKYSWCDILRQYIHNGIFGNYTFNSCYVFQCALKYFIL